jgi:hypothetical protein
MHINQNHGSGRIARSGGLLFVGKWPSVQAALHHKMRLEGCIPTIRESDASNPKALVKPAAPGTTLRLVWAQS